MWIFVLLAGCRYHLEPGIYILYTLYYQEISDKFTSSHEILGKGGYNPGCLGYC